MGAVNGGSERCVGLTVCQRLRTGSGGRAPQVHPRVRDVGRPGEQDCVDIIKSQPLVLRTWVDPVDIAATRKYENIPEKQEEDGVAMDIPMPGGTHRCQKSANRLASSTPAVSAKVKKNSIYECREICKVLRGAFDLRRLTPWLSLFFFSTDLRPQLHVQPDHYATPYEPASYCTVSDDLMHLFHAHSCLAWFFVGVAHAV